MSTPSEPQTSSLVTTGASNLSSTSITSQTWLQKHTVLIIAILSITLGYFLTDKAIAIVASYESQSISQSGPAAAPPVSPSVVTSLIIGLRKESPNLKRGKRVTPQPSPINGGQSATRRKTMWEGSLGIGAFFSFCFPVA